MIPEADELLARVLSPEKYERLTGDLPKCKSNCTKKNDR
jgi:hypothetical protein